MLPHTARGLNKASRNLRPSSVKFTIAIPTTEEAVQLAEELLKTSWTTKAQLQ